MCENTSFNVFWPMAAALFTSRHKISHNVAIGTTSGSTLR